MSQGFFCRGLSSERVLGSSPSVEKSLEGVLVAGGAVSFLRYLTFIIIVTLWNVHVVLLNMPYLYCEAMFP